MSLASVSGKNTALAPDLTTNQALKWHGWWAEVRCFSITVQFLDGALTLAEYSHRASPTAKERWTSRIQDVPEADPDRMETLVARPLRPWKQDPTESIRFGLPHTFPEGDVPVTIESERSLAID